MKSSGFHLAVVVGAFITSVLTALANVLIARTTTIDVFTFSVLFVLPIGALLIGAGGASGGLLACRYFNVRPTAIDFVVMVVIGAFTMWLIYYLDYRTLVLEDGRRASEIVPFGTYFDLVTTKSHLRVGRGQTDTGEVGSYGYWLVFFKFIGVLIGGAAVFAFLKGMAFCESCRVYFKKLAKRSTSQMTPEEGQTLYNMLHGGTVDAYQAALDMKPSDTTNKKERTVMATFTLMGCPKCKLQFMSEEFQALKGNEWRELKELSRRTDMPADVDMRPFVR